MEKLGGNMFLDKNNKRWYKGNLHTHTTLSDGEKTPEEVVALYRAKGYDFLALTDHWVTGDGWAEDDFLMLSGVEYDTGGDMEKGIYHIVGVGMQRPVSLDSKPRPDAQTIIDKIHEADGMPILAHPSWSMNRAWESCRLTGLEGCEIYNTTSGLPFNCRPYSGAFLDDMANLGCFLPCMAADDAHNYCGDETRSYLMVQADELSRDAILAAIRRGDFYSSQGPRFSVSREGDTIKVVSTPVESIVFFTNWIWEPDRAAVGHGICEAQFKIKPEDRWVRIELADADGNMAWSSFYQV